MHGLRHQNGDQISETISNWNNMEQITEVEEETYFSTIGRPLTVE